MTTEEIQAVERTRAVHVLKEMLHLGADIRIGEDPTTDGTIEALDHAGALTTLVRTKVNLGPDAILSLYIP